MAGEVAALVGYSVGRFGLFKLLKWMMGIVCVVAGVAGLSGSSNPGEVLISVGLLATPIVWFLVRRHLRAQRTARLYAQAVQEVRAEWNFTSNEPQARQQVVEIAKAVRRSPETVWADVVGTGQ